MVEVEKFLQWGLEVENVLLVEEAFVFWLFVIIFISNLVEVIAFEQLVSMGEEAYFYSLKVEVEVELFVGLATIWWQL